MEEVIELIVESPDGIIDCRLEPVRNGGELYYSATILYPNVVNGFSRSEIYCHNMWRDSKMGNYYFETGENGVHPKIKKIEKELSAAIEKMH
jgi:hypothetical protein